MNSDTTDDLVELKKIFGRWASNGLDELMEEEHSRTASDILNRISLSPGDYVLDLGTGNGFAAKSLAAKESHAHVFGLDLSPEMAQSARSLCSEPEIEAVVGDMHSLPMRSDAFDHVFMMDVIEYSPSPEGALREINRVLRPGGQLFCANWFYKEMVDVQPELADREGTRLCWSKAEFRKAFLNCGFNSIQQTHVADEEATIPSDEVCKQRGWRSRSHAETVYRELGVLLTIGTADRS